jgi:type II secretory pathway component PulJ
VKQLTLQSMRKARRPAGRWRGRAAFTLIEVILAVGLSALLILCIASAMDLYRRMTTAATDDMSETRLVRAIFAKFEVDLRDLVPPQPIAATATTTAGSSSGSSSSSSGSSSSSSSSSSSTQSAQGTDPLQYVYSRTVFGLYGDASSLVLNTLTPHPLPLAAQQQTGAQSASQTSSAGPSQIVGVHGDMKVVAYFVLGGPQSPILPAGGSGQMTPDGKEITAGLARVEGERTAIGYAIETGSTSSLRARVVAPEIESISFRYFDGTGWQTSWSGATLQNLPQAVEITISVGKNDPYNARTQASQDQASRSYRHVVAITSSAAPQPISQQTINSTVTNMSQ